MARQCFALLKLLIEEDLAKDNKKINKKHPIEVPLPKENSQMDCQKLKDKCLTNYNKHVNCLEISPFAHVTARQGMGERVKDFQSSANGSKVPYY